MCREGSHEVWVYRNRDMLERDTDYPSFSRFTRQKYVYFPNKRTCAPLTARNVQL